MAPFRVSFKFSEPLEALIERHRSSAQDAPATAHIMATADWVVIGSGYGGAITAFRLGQALQPEPDCDGTPAHPFGVLVLERGKEYLPGDFPADLAHVPNNLRYQGADGSVGGSSDGLYDMRFGDGVDALVGNGLGGGSLINANVAVQPTPAIWAKRAWPEQLRIDANDGTLAQAYAEVARWLGANTDDTLREFGKFQGLKRLANGLGADTKANGMTTAGAELAPIAVTRGALGGCSMNAAGIAQPHCSNCGNCVSGCNVGAKNTLAMNFIPAAWRLGVRFVTNASVITVSATDAPAAHATADDAPQHSCGGPLRSRWRIVVQPTASGTPKDSLRPYMIHAANVVLAAGAFGSTELLQRSARFAGLTGLSKTLGSCFSTNGDGIAMSYAGTEPVHGVGTERFGEGHNCGPTISTMVRGSVATVDPENPKAARIVRQFTLQDAAIPAALQALYGELMVFGAQIGRLGSAKQPKWFEDHPGADPIAVHPAALTRSQTLLLMTEDAADGALALRSETGDAAHAHQWHAVPSVANTPGKPADAHLEAIDAALVRQSYGAGMAGGQYVANPLWRPMPKAAQSAMSGAMPGGRMITVHPLGGCPMGDDCTRGVVDSFGRVFDSNRAANAVGDNVHPGLYVLDGAIVPTALGTNPLLTISALAWRACDSIVAGFPERAPATRQRALPTIDFPHVRPDSDTQGALSAARIPTQLIMRERLVGTLSDGPHSSANGLAKALGISSSEAQRLLDRDGLVLDIHTLPEASDDFINGSAPVRIRVDAYVNPVSAKRTEAQHAFGMTDATLAQATCIARGTGTLTALTRARDAAPATLNDTLLALAAFVKRRATGSMFGPGSASPNEPAKPLLSRVGGMINSGLAFLQVARMHAGHREFAYQLKLTANSTHMPITMRGQKPLAWRNGNARIWEALTHVNLDVQIDRQHLQAALVVDTEHMFGEGLITTHQSAHGPDIVTKALALGGRFARAILQTSFWEFGGVDYPDTPIKRNPDPRALRTRRGSIDAQHFQTLHVPRFKPRTFTDELGVTHDHHSPATVPLALTRYARPGATKHAVLVHGLAQGSLIYCSEAIGTNMALYLWEAGYDVWMVDYRLSNRFNGDDATKPDWFVPFDGWCMDEIGVIDMPAAITRIVEVTGRPVNVFAHCVGAVGMEIAIASGKLGPQHVASLAINAIHPWVQPALANRVRARLGVFFRDVLGNDLFDPIPQTKSTVNAAQSILDRFAFSFARLDEEAEDRHDPRARHSIANAICDRMTFLYGRMWRHANLRDELHASWPDLVGRAPGAVFRHMYYMLINGVVLNEDGQHTYMTDANVQQHWRGIPTLFMHGEESDVFNPQSATESALRLFNLIDPKRHDGVFGDATHVKLLRVPGYGHMDPILAEHAHRTVFPKLERFFAQPTSPHGTDFDDIEDIALSIAVPPPPFAQLRAARMDADGQLHLRYVDALPELATPVFTDLRLLHPAMAAQRSFHPAQCNSARFRVVDVQLDPARYGPPDLAAVTAETSDPDGGPEPRRYSRINQAAPAFAAAEVVQPFWLQRLQQRHRNGGQPLNSMHFIVGACLYPGTAFDRNVPERIFSAMDAHMQHEPTDLLLLIGDQIYADATAGLMDPAALYDRYTERYECVLENPVIAKTLKQLPVHFTVDDHEITDNFAGATPEHPDNLAFGLDARLQQRLRALRSGDVLQEQFEFARGTAVGFLGSGRNVRPFAHEVAASARTHPSPLWYALDHHSETNCPMFIMDARSERTTDPVTAVRRMLSDTQMRALKDWLRDAHTHTPDRPKFIVCGSVIVPVLREYHQHEALWAREDGFAGFPEETAELFEFIAEQQLRGIVFMGGDLHLSAVADIELRSADGAVAARVTQIVASELYAPLPFTNTAHRYYEWGAGAPQRLRLPSALTATYRAELVTDSSSHFVKVDVEASGAGQGWKLRVRAVDSGGAVVGQAERTIQ